jgi:hypothetical protein
LGRIAIHVRIFSEFFRAFYQLYASHCYCIVKFYNNSFVIFLVIRLDAIDPNHHSNHVDDDGELFVVDLNNFSSSFQDEQHLQRWMRFLLIE